MRGDLLRSQHQDSTQTACLGDPAQNRWTILVLSHVAKLSLRKKTSLAMNKASANLSADI